MIAVKKIFLPNKNYYVWEANRDPNTWPNMWGRIRTVHLGVLGLGWILSFSFMLLFFVAQEWLSCSNFEQAKLFDLYLPSTIIFAN